MLEEQGSILVKDIVEEPEFPAMPDADEFFLELRREGRKRKEVAQLETIRRSSEYTDDFTDSEDWTEDSWYLTMQKVI